MIKYNIHVIKMNTLEKLIEKKTLNSTNIILTWKKI